MDGFAIAPSDGQSTPPIGAPGASATASAPRRAVRPLGPLPRFSRNLGKTGTAAACVALAIATVILLGWWIPGLARLLPEHWDLMKANTAACTALSGIAILLAGARKSRWAPAARIAANVALGLLAGASSFSLFAEHSTYVETLLAADATSEIPGRMSVQSGVFFCAQSVLVWRIGRRWSLFARAFLALQGVVCLLVISGYAFRALYLTGQSYEIRAALHTAIAMVMLLWATFSTMVDVSRESIFVSSGLGGTLLRRALPLVVGVPLVLIWFGAWASTRWGVSVPYAAALTNTVLVTFLVIAAMLVARRIEHLDALVRREALTDPLTNLLNPRGFYTQAELALRILRRSDQRALLIFIDLDGLKEVNDRLGHDAGSEMIRDFAGLLSSTLRTSDVVGRLGGDEFVALAAGEASGSDQLLDRLAKATARRNEHQRGAPPIRYSVGAVTIEPGDTRELSELVHRADKNMYKNKEVRRASGQISRVR